MKSRDGCVLKPIRILSLESKPHWQIDRATYPMELKNVKITLRTTQLTHFWTNPCAMFILGYKRHLYLFPIRNVRAGLKARKCRVACTHARLIVVWEAVVYWCKSATGRKILFKIDFYIFKGKSTLSWTICPVILHTNCRLQTGWVTSKRQMENWLQTCFKPVYFSVKQSSQAASGFRKWILHANNSALSHRKYSNIYGTFEWWPHGYNWYFRWIAK